MKGLIVHVLRPAGFPDCTLNGISSRVNELTIVGFVERHRKDWKSVPEEMQIFEPSPEHPAVLVEIFHTRTGLYKAIIPLETLGRWHMAGGNYAVTTDSRFSQHVNGYPVAIHDRIE